jgi:heme o synthase
MKLPGQASVERTGVSAFLADWATLTKLRIGAFVFLAAWLGAVLAKREEGLEDLFAGLEPALWVLAVSAGSSIFNQVFERNIDRLMERTSARPLPAGRVPLVTAIAVGGVLGLGGTLMLALRFNLLVALCAIGTLVAYSMVYTPLKRLTTHNTLVGAVPGAMAPLLGYMAIAGTVGPWGWYLFLIMFVWQFPHFMAIAWIYREDYARGGLRMLPSLPGAAGLAGRNALLYALVLVPVSLLPGTRNDASFVYLFAAFVMGLVYLAFALAFALREDRTRARALLLASLIYLPIVFAAALFDRDLGY